MKRPIVIILPLFSSTYHSRLFREFKAIPPDTPREIVRFYDEHEQAILQLDFEEYFELLVAYVDALFHIGKYRRHLLMVDIVIEHVIQANIFSYQDRDLFFEMLTRKGLSLLRTYEYPKAQHIFKQLIKIDPSKEMVVKNLEEAIRGQGAPIQHRMRAVGISLLFLVAIIIGLDILLVYPFYGAYSSFFKYLYSSIFILACLIIAVGERIHWWRSAKKAKQIQQQALQLREKTKPA